MGYRTDLVGACNWLISNQNSDDGWGLAPRQASSLVNTAEALFILRKSIGYESQIARGLSFIRSHALIHLERHGPRTRYITYSLVALSTPLIPNDIELCAFCRDWLIGARNHDGAWGFEAGNQHSDIFSTCLALIALRLVSNYDDVHDAALKWVLSRGTEMGWSLSQNGGSSSVATAYAVLCLAGSRYSNHDKLRVAKSLLLQTRHWGTVEQVVPGTVWKHSTFSWVIPALISLGENPYCPTIAQGIRYINTLRSSGGGWHESPEGAGQTVRSQYWPVVAHSAVLDEFDPAIHVLRIDGDIVQPSLSEPEFVKVAIDTRWATIVPARLYKLAVYVCLAMSIGVLFGLPRSLATLPTNWDSAIASAGFLLTWFLVQKRKRYFGRRAYRVSAAAAAFLAIMGSLFGADLSGMLEFSKNLTYNVFEIGKQIWGLVTK